MWDIAAWSVVALWLTVQWCVLSIALMRTARAVPALPHHVATPEGGWPSLSVVVPARNEASGVEAAVRSLLALDYPHLQVVAVDDRSEDGTGALLDALASDDARLRVLHVHELPPGWLGKTHALHRGAQIARGEWLLFTDGDVVFASDAARRGVAHAERHGLGHLTAFPRLEAESLPERAFLAAFAVLFAARFRLWELSRAGSRAYVGVGAFNLVRTSAYQAVGGHAPLAMEVVDDVKLGLILRRGDVRQGGVRQGAVQAGDAVRVRWQPGLWDAMRGLVKNAFAGAEYRWWPVASGLIYGLAMTVLPWAGLLLAPTWWLRAGMLLPIALAAVLHGAAAWRQSGGSGLEGLTYPVVDLLLMGTVLWSAVAATWRGGIVWRGTRYELAELRARCVREAAHPPDRAPGASRRR